MSRCSGFWGAPRTARGWAGWSSTGRVGSPAGGFSPGDAVQTRLSADPRNTNGSLFKTEKAFSLIIFVFYPHLSRWVLRTGKHAYDDAAGRRSVISEWKRQSPNTVTACLYRKSLDTTGALCGSSGYILQFIYLLSYLVSYWSWSLFKQGHSLLSFLIFAHFPSNFSAPFLGCGKSEHF